RSHESLNETEFYNADHDLECSVVLKDDEIIDLVQATDQEDAADGDDAETEESGLTTKVESTPSSSDASQATQALLQYFEANTYATAEDIELVNKLRRRVDSDRDDAPGLVIPPFRPENVPGLQLPECRTKHDTMKYLTPDLVEQICKFKNDYLDATKNQILKLPLAKNWTPLTPDEFYVFIGLLMYFSIAKLPRLELYWSTEELFHCLWARAFMSKPRYKQIQSFLKVANHTTERRSDKLTKMRFLHEYIYQKEVHETLAAT
ncbi:PiggyBac transposable element-derived protein 4, partial [Elysia marginata]